MNQTSTPTRDGGLRIALGITAVLVVVGLFFAARGPSIAEVEPGTPEATVQQYVQTIIDDELDSAVGFLAVEDRCDSPSYFSPRDETISIALRDVVIDGDGVDGDEAEVEVQITESYGDGLGSSYTQDATFELIRVGGVWQITDGPYQFDLCGRF